MEVGVSTREEVMRPAGGSHEGHPPGAVGECAGDRPAEVEATRRVRRRGIGFVFVRQVGEAIEDGAVELRQRPAVAVG